MSSVQFQGVHGSRMISQRDLGREENRVRQMEEKGLKTILIKKNPQKQINNIYGIDHMNPNGEIVGTKIVWFKYVGKTGEFFELLDTKHNRDFLIEQFTSGYFTIEDLGLRNEIDISYKISVAERQIAQIKKSIADGSAVKGDEALALAQENLTNLKRCLKSSNPHSGMTQREIELDERAQETERKNKELERQLAALQASQAIAATVTETVPETPTATVVDAEPVQVEVAVVPAPETETAPAETPEPIAAVLPTVGRRGPGRPPSAVRKG